MISHAYNFLTKINSLLYSIQFLPIHHVQFVVQVMQRGGNLAKVELCFLLRHLVHCLYSVVQFTTIAEIQHDGCTGWRLQFKKKE